MCSSPTGPGEGLRGFEVDYADGDLSADFAEAINYLTHVAAEPQDRDGPPHSALQPSQVEPSRLWSLLDIMRKFDLNTLAQHLLQLVEDRNWCDRIAHMDGADQDVTRQQWAHFVRQFNELEELASSAEFPTAFANVSALNATIDLGRPPNVSHLEADLRHVTDMFMNDVERCSFLRVPVSLRRYVDNDTLFGSSVATAFPSANMDLRAAGNCLAADCNTAAVFHLMRAVEWALRALGTHLGFRQLRAQKKSGKRKYVPISHLEWEKVIDQLQLRVDRRVEKMRPGKRKQGIQQFYYPLLQEIRAIRDAWRNHVMHSRSEYSGADALAIMGHVERLMVTLATRVSET